ncbi:MAG TPA: hypothetical protein ENI80_11500 [Acidiferrobacteraceae bacterium]|nr:hypothetical protein [Acidiferrobacteraceae bacterium]
MSKRTRSVFLSSLITGILTIALVSCGGGGGTSTGGGSGSTILKGNVVTVVALNKVFGPELASDIRQHILARVVDWVIAPVFAQTGGVGGITVISSSGASTTTDGAGNFSMGTTPGVQTITFQTQTGGTASTSVNAQASATTTMSNVSLNTSSGQASVGSVTSAPNTDNSNGSNGNDNGAEGNDNGAEGNGNENENEDDNGNENSGNSNG